MSVWKRGTYRRQVEFFAWVASTEYFVNDLLLTHEGEYTAEDKAFMLGYATQTAWLFGGERLLSSGLGKIAVRTFAQIALIYYVGKWTSQLIDPDQGKNNFHGFISAGLIGGSNDPNYWSGDQNESGYFNFPKNISTIISYEAPNEDVLKAADLPDTYWDPRAKTWVANQEEAIRVVQWMYRKGYTTQSEQFAIASLHGLEGIPQVL